MERDADESSEPWRPPGKVANLKNTFLTSKQTELESAILTFMGKQEDHWNRSFLTYDFRAQEW